MLNRRRARRERWALTVALALSAFACTGEPRRAAPPPAPPIVAGIDLRPPAATGTTDVVEVLHGVDVPDPYRWLEDTTAANVRAWTAGQSRFTDSVLARLVGRDSLRALVERTYAAAPSLDVVQPTVRGLLLTRWLGSSPSLLAVDSGQTTERVVVAAETLARSTKGLALRAISPSWDGRQVALGTTARGDADAAIQLVEVATGRTLPDRIPDLLTTTSGTRYEVSWLPDGSGFFYPRMWPGSAKGPAAERLARGRQFLHRVGTPQSTDVAVFGFGVSPAVEMQPEDLPTRVYTMPGSAWLVGSVFRSKANGTQWYFAPLPKTFAAAPEWKTLASVNGRVSLPQLRGDTVYALSRGTADRGQIVRRVLQADGDGRWDTVVPEQSGVITNFTVQRDGLYLTQRERGAVVLQRLAPGATTLTTVTLPAVGTVRLTRGEPTSSGVIVAVESWTSAPRWLRVSANGASAQPLLADDGSAKATLAGTVSARLETMSQDSTKVPVSLVYGPAALRGGVLDGTAPLLVDAYGGFGVATDPFYYPLVHTWVALGGVYAYVHARGGGELGDAWHTAAMRAHKQRTIDDVIGAIDALIDARYTSAGRVTIIGTSFGANIPGLAMLQRPELFGAVLYEVGQPDEIRGSRMDPTAARNIAEIGDLDTPEGIRLLMQSSPYHQVTKPLKLPAIIVHSASDDYNFGTEMLAGKYVARLQEANTGSRPVIWIRTEGGHQNLFGLSPSSAATALSFALWQSGVAAYQPRPASRTP